MNNISNILFDLDGTLTDPQEGITRCIQFALAELGAPQPEPESLIWCIGPPLRHSFSVLLNTNDGATLDQALKHYRKRFSTVGMFENKIYPETLPSLQRIRESGFQLFLATSKPRVYAERIVEHFGVLPFLHVVYGSELDGRMTDKGELIAHILDSEKLEPEETLIIGDRSHDIVGGKKNEIRTAAVTYGYGTREEITAAGPDMIFESLSDAATHLIEKRKK